MKLDWRIVTGILILMVLFIAFGGYKGTAYIKNYVAEKVAAEKERINKEKESAVKEVKDQIAVKDTQIKTSAKTITTLRKKIKDMEEAPQPTPPVTTADVKERLRALGIEVR